MKRRDDTRLPPVMRFRIRAHKTRLQVDSDFFTEAADIIEQLADALETLVDCWPDDTLPNGPACVKVAAALAKAKGSE